MAEVTLAGDEQGDTPEPAGSMRLARRSHLSATPDGRFTLPRDMRVYAGHPGAFQPVVGSNVLIYFPHGFGDWVQISHVLPLFEPSNRYWICRFGDDSASVMEGSSVQPVYLGAKAPRCDYGSGDANCHFGINGDLPDGTVQRLSLPVQLHELCRRNAIDVVFYPRFWDTGGNGPFPVHTKARNLLNDLRIRERAPSVDLAAPLRSCIDFRVDPWVTRWVEARLGNFGGFGARKLCLISRHGFTGAGKNWGHLFREDLPEGRRREGEECREFMRLMLRKDPDWMFLTMEDRMFAGDDSVRSDELHCYSYAQVFGELGTGVLLFGLALKALTNLADLAVGVPAGPRQLWMAHPSLPTVGIWIEQMPSWYDEPKEASIHVLSANLRASGADSRPGSFTRLGALEFRTVRADTRPITGEQVLQAAEALLG
jgi:hypothetical protein